LAEVSLRVENEAAQVIEVQADQNAEDAREAA
jgi:hypothetical protein